MSEPIRKPGHVPESYSPKKKPEIVSLAQAQVEAEKCIDTFTHDGVVFEVMERPETLWVGTLAWATDDNSEPDGGALYERFSSLLDIPKQALIHPDWSAGISIKYKRGATGPFTQGLMYAQKPIPRNKTSAMICSRSPQAAI